MLIYTEEVRAKTRKQDDPEILEVGKVGLRYGQRNASSDYLAVTVHGRAAHGAYPTGGVDAIVAAVCGPTNTSAPFTASVRLRLSVRLANSCL